MTIICPLCDKPTDRLVRFGKGKVCPSCFDQNSAKLPDIAKSGFYDGFDEGEEE